MHWYSLYHDTIVQGKILYQYHVMSYQLKCWYTVIEFDWKIKMTWAKSWFFFFFRLLCLVTTFNLILVSRNMGGIWSLVVHYGYAKIYYHPFYQQRAICMFWLPLPLCTFITRENIFLPVFYLLKVKLQHGMVRNLAARLGTKLYL